ncbi:TonB-linked outer membrane protein, SusC/RagA family [Spirosomataceae bacterium TFI 002]|nr:TonB-linked outer membrane protein, SusC/RagA family [Spirosomataceae bacterium TFI 002]
MKVLPKTIYQSFSTLLCFLCLFYTAQAQTKITGKVTDEESLGLPGVTIVVKGTTIGTTTDMEGLFSLQVPSKDQTLVVSYIGYTTQELAIGNKTNFNISMSVDAANLDEIVVIGYGTVKKKDLTGAVSQIDAKRLESEATSNISDMLRGSVPGLAVGFNNGPKGISSAGDFQVRGQTTVRTDAAENRAANAPLIVLDGMIYSGDLADINPTDISTFDILKDASSAAIYGSRASNGVILITTKRGKTGKPTINVSSSIGTTALSGQEIDVLGPQQFIDWRIAGFESAQRKQLTSPGYYNNPASLPSGVNVDAWKAYDGSTENPDNVSVWLNRLGMSDREINNYKEGNTENWADRIYQTGIRNDHNLSISGSTDKTSYYWSLGYVNNESHVYNDSYNAIRTRLNFEATVTDFLKVGTNMQFAAKDESPYASSQNLNNNTPFGSFYEDDGVTIAAAPTDNISNSRHPYLNLTYNVREVKNNAINAKIYGIVTFPLGITLTSEYIPSINWNRSFSHRSSADPFSLDNGYVNRINYNSYGWQMNNIVKWNKELGLHRFDVTLLQNAEKFQDWRTEVARSQFQPSDVLGYHDIGSATNDVNINSSDNYETGTALMARLNYVFNDRYLLTGAFRRDGYSAFGQKNPTADFGSVAAAWTLSEEEFFKSKLIDLLKLRFSVGTNGNRSIGRYSALSNLNTGRYVQIINGSPQYVSQLYSTRLANADLQWEKTTAYNLGLDYSLKNGRINGSLEVYYMKTKDLLIARSLPDVTGYNSVTSNLGQVDNRGFEINVNTVNIQKNSFSWRSGFALSFNRNKVVHLYGDMEDVLDGSGNVIGQKESDDVTNQWFIGHALDEIWDYEVLGIWQTDEAEVAKTYSRSPGDYKIDDKNGDGVYTNEDKVFQGYSIPQYRLNLRNDFKYKNFDLSIKMYSYLGYKSSNNHLKNDDVFYDRASGFDVPYWTAENPNNKWARVESYSSGFNVYENNSFLRVDNIALSYSVPSNIIEKAKIGNMRLSLIAQNPAVYAPTWSWMDPEQKGYTPSFYTFKVNLTL